jgi:hypothetical protein
MPQAILAAEVGCTYVAPYVNELKVQFNAGYVLLLIEKGNSLQRQEFC